MIRLVVVVEVPTEAIPSEDLSASSLFLSLLEIWNEDAKKFNKACGELGNFPHEQLELFGGSAENNREHAPELFRLSLFWLKKLRTLATYLFPVGWCCFWRHSLSRTSWLLHLQASEESAGANNALSGGAVVSETRAHGSSTWVQFDFSLILPPLWIIWTAGGRTLLRKELGTGEMVL